MLWENLFLAVVNVTWEIIRLVAEDIRRKFITSTMLLGNPYLTAMMPENSSETVLVLLMFITFIEAGIDYFPKIFLRRNFLLVACYSFKFTRFSYSL